MFQFQCDYSEGAHPKILERLQETNMVQTPGYGNDDYCEQARQHIRALTECPDADVHFFVGGTQTNATVISSILRPYQGVVSADSGHISTHETGSVEHLGHKVITLPSRDGKISAHQLDQLLENIALDDNREHIVQPGMVYISYPTEVGTLYTRQELADLKNTCHRHNLPLYCDGARLGYGLTADTCDISLPEFAHFFDVFYIGGTKCGTLIGEAVVINNDNLKPGFKFCMKQQGALLAKGRLLGIQFEVLFTDNLYFDICDRANRLAMQLRETLRRKGYPFYVDSYTNQQFPILPNKAVEQLAKDFMFTRWEATDPRHMAVRFCTCWATTQEAVDSLCDAIDKL